ncbi:aromatic amino acid aminotransferase [Bacillus coahuilensis p1.1.43]|uniref:Aminotransferase n=1 Tax=Bacillus coahuilensis p1.1.43 TaxID=1150625 RepID=A0A147K669_9BACI|nr:aminotransferase [Bacillus coahuilensis]KUP05336.1 aromatic amino acid aminotransferase [Bacillus coahuilensis p1.1.43]
MLKAKKSYLSHVVKELPPSGIRKFFDLANGMEDVISLGVGEPDFTTSWRVREAAIVSFERGYTAYTANAGLIELRKEITKYCLRNFDVEYNPENEIIVTIGASQALDIALRAIVNPGEEVIVIEPSFVSYAPLVELCGGKAVRIQTKGEEEFKLQPEDLRAAITDRTKAILICSPNNPTGTVMEKEDYLKLLPIIEEHDLLVISDEIYSELVYDGTHQSVPALPGMYERTIFINGFSKGFAMTGWRLGFLCAPREFTEAMLKIHQYSVMCASTAAQYGALEALREGSQDVLSMKKSYEQRRNYFVKSCNEIGLACHKPGGAFYSFPSVKATGMSSAEFAEKLLVEERVAVVPGNVFGESGEGFVRCSYASSITQLEEAIRRMSKFMNNHS